jgi:hypothetical protein
MARRHALNEEDGRLADLAAEIDELKGEVRSLSMLRDDVASQGRALAHLSRLVRRTPAGSSQSTDGDLQATSIDADDQEDEVVPEWMLVQDAAQAVAWLNDLTVWVPKVWARYPGAAMPKCWPWHPAAVAELLTTRHVWAAATADGAGADALAAWHDRWRPGTVKRVGQVMSGCERAQGCHTNITMKHWRFDLDQLDDLAVWWATSSINPNVDYESAPGLTHEPVHPDRIPTVDVRARGRR